MDAYDVAFAEDIRKTLVGYIQTFGLFFLAAAIGDYIHAEGFCQGGCLHADCASSDYSQSLAFKLPSNMLCAGTACSSYFVANRNMPVNRYHQSYCEFGDCRSRIASAIAYGDFSFTASIQIHMVHSGKSHRNEFEIRQCFYYLSPKRAVCNYQNVCVLAP